MSEFDRFDICEAYAVMEWDYNDGGWLQERPSNRRRMEATSVQLHRMQFRPSLDLSYKNMSDNAKEIYRAAEFRYGFRPQRIKSERHDLVKCLDALELFTTEEVVDFDRLVPKDLLASATLVLTTLIRQGERESASGYDDQFELRISELEEAVDALQDTLDWLFDEPAPVPLAPGTPMPFISAEYNANGYVVLVDDAVVYRAGNSAYESTEVVPADQGLSLERIRIMAEISAKDECDTKNGCFLGAKEVTELP